MPKTKAGPLEWNLGLLYSSPKDPQIEKDMKELEDLCANFSKKYDTSDKGYLKDESKLLSALKSLELIYAKSDAKPFLYFYFLRDIEADNNLATSEMSLFQNRLSKCENLITFFKISLGSLSKIEQDRILKSSRLAHYKVFLSRVFDDSRFMLSIPEEKILNLKAQPAYEMWVSGNERMLNMKSVHWKNKQMPLAQALTIIQTLPKKSERMKLAKEIATVLKAVAPFSEAEINAVVINKKIDDDLRGFKTACESTIQRYRNDKKVVEELVKTVSCRFDIAHRFYKIKAKLLKERYLSYSERSLALGKVKTKFTFKDSAAILKEIFGKLNPLFAHHIDSYIANGQIDVVPRIGKKSGAYCAATYENPTFILLNHTDDYHSFTTMAHELGHAFHGELSRSQGPFYSDYSTALAETASTLFESIAREETNENLSKKEQIIALHDKISGDVATVFRQIACFNYEQAIHRNIRSRGFMSKEELSLAHNEEMSRYLGPTFKLTPDDGYFFVHWSHIRRFFYVYSYAYGMLVSKALLRRYKADPSFWKKIEFFLSAGGKASPEEILKEIGIDLSKPGFFEEGLSEIEDDIKRLEKMASDWK